MNERQEKEPTSGVRDREIRAALDQHWAASDANDLETEHRIYHEDAVLEYPQSGERTRGRRNIQNQRASQLSKKRFTVRRIIGGGDLWVTEFILKYDGKPSYTVSIMEFRDDKVVRETQYFADPFVAPHGALNGSNGWTHNRRERETNSKGPLGPAERGFRRSRIVSYGIWLQPILRRKDTGRSGKVKEKAAP